MFAPQGTRVKREAMDRFQLREEELLRLRDLVEVVLGPPQPPQDGDTELQPLDITGSDDEEDEEKGEAKRLGEEKAKRLSLPKNFGPCAPGRLPQLATGAANVLGTMRGQRTLRVHVLRNNGMETESPCYSCCNVEHVRENTFIIDDGQLGGVYVEMEVLVKLASMRAAIPSKDMYELCSKNLEHEIWSQPMEYYCAFDLDEDSDADGDTGPVL